MSDKMVPFTPSHVTVYRGVGVPASPGTTIMVPESHLASITAANEAARARGDADNSARPPAPAPEEGATASITPKKK